MSTTTAVQASVDSLERRVYTVPTDAPEADGTIAWNSTTMVLVTVSSGTAVGLGYTYAPAAAADAVRNLLAPVVTGRSVMDVAGSWNAMIHAIRNAGRQGIASCAVSAVDTALWDLKSRLLELPLHHLLGAVREQVPIYGSGGFTTYSAEQLQDQLSGWVGQGIDRVKIKIGESWGTEPRRDKARMRHAREVIGNDVELFVDANGGYNTKSAMRIMDDVAELDVRWFEEPVSSDNLAGLAAVRRRVRAEVAAGEYGWDPYYFQRMCAAGAVDCLQADVTRCGGITGWLKAAMIAEAHELDISGHCAPHISVHAAAATSNLRHLEWFHDHVRIEQLFFDGTLSPEGGQLTPKDTAAGHGLCLRTHAAEPFRVA